jgi:predicted TIM-barrel fold metal-dependent hydrolase
MSRRIDSGFPFPLSDVSNGEWIPRPPNDKQRAAARMLGEEADKRAKKLGMSRRQFLRTAAGTATAYMVLNTVHGLDQSGPAAALPIRREQCDDPEAGRELFKKEYFVMDVQLHHVDTEVFPSGFDFLRFRNRGSNAAETNRLLSQMNMIKEVFIDSETAVGVVSGIPNGVPLPVETMAATRDLVNEIAGSQRALSQVMCDPRNAPEHPTSIASMEHQVRDLKGSAVKCYTGAGAWWLDDEEVAYPMLEEATRLGLRVVNVHKGFPLQFFPMSRTYVQSRDLPKVSRDWPRLSFVAYHSGYFGGDPLGGLTGIDEFLSVVQSIRPRRNIYAELGSSFAAAFTQGPVAAAHLVGSLLRDLGPNRIVWGTDSIWWGSPQWQIDAFKTLEIPEDLQIQYGYPPLTQRVKRHILGLNAARLYRVRPSEKRCTVAEDRIGKLRQDREWVEQNRSLRVYGPRTRRELLALLRREGEIV